MDVLILSVSAGGGHMRASEYLKEYIEAQEPSSRVMIVDTLRYVHPIYDKLIIGSYLNSIKSTPALYGKLYEMAESGENLTEFSQSINKILSFKIKRLIREFNPEVIVCTHPFPLQMLSSMKEKKIINVPVVAILTDFAVHNFWLYDFVDSYVVAHPLMKAEMEFRGIPGDIIHPLGMPISKEFSKQKNREKILKDQGLEDKTTILLMGGSLGYGEISEVFISLLMSQRDIQIIAVTGKNTKLKKKLERWSYNSRKKVKLFSFTGSISDLMAVSDAIITKPGGMTISEALAMRLPIIIISPIPGQEEKNAQFLINSGVAARASRNDNIEFILMQVLDNPIRVRHIKEMAESMSKPDSCEKIYSLLRQLIDNNRPL